MSTNKSDDMTYAGIPRILKRRYNVQTDKGVVAMYDNSGTLSDEDLNNAKKELRTMAKDWSELLKERLSNIEKEGIIVKESFVTLKDNKNRSRVIISMIEEGTLYPYVYIGIAIRSAEDKHSDKYGQRLAKSRAIRAMKGRKPCWVTRDEAVQNIQSLCFKDFKRLMFFTRNMVKNFKKGICFNGTIKTLRKELYNATKTA